MSKGKGHGYRAQEVAVQLNRKRRDRFDAVAQRDRFGKRKVERFNQDNQRHNREGTTT